MLTTLLPKKIVEGAFFSRSAMPFWLVRKAVHAILLLLLGIFVASVGGATATVAVDLCALSANNTLPSEMVIPLHTMAENATAVLAIAEGCEIVHDIRFMLPGGNDTARALSFANVSIVLVHIAIRGNVVLVGGPGVAVIARFTFSMISSQIDSPSLAVVVTAINLHQSWMLFQDSIVRTGMRALYFSGRGGTGMLASFQRMNVTLLNTSVTVDHRSHDPAVGALVFDYAPGAGSEAWLLSTVTIMVIGSTVAIGTPDDHWDWPLGVSTLGPCQDMVLIARNTRFESPRTRLVAFLSFRRIFNASITVLSSSVSVTDFDTYTVLQYLGLAERLSLVVVDLNFQSQTISISRHERGLVTFDGGIIDSTIELRQIQTNVKGGTFRFAQLTRPDGSVRAAQSVYMSIRFCDIRHTYSSRSATRFVYLVGVAGDVHVEVSDCNVHLTETVGAAFLLVDINGLTLNATRCYIWYQSESTYVIFGGDNPKDVISNSRFVFDDFAVVNVGTTSVANIAVVEWVATVVNVTVIYSGQFRYNALFSRRLFNFPGGPCTGFNLTVDGSRFAFDKYTYGSRSDTLMWFAQPVVASTIVVSNIRMAIDFPLAVMRFASTVESTTIALVNVNITTKSAWRAFEMHGSLLDSEIIVSGFDLASRMLSSSPFWSGLIMFVDPTAANITNSHMVLQNIRFECHFACGVIYTTGLLQGSLIAVSYLTYLRYSTAADVDLIGWTNQSVQIVPPPGDPSVAETTVEPAMPIENGHEVQEAVSSSLGNTILFRCVTSDVTNRASGITVLQGCPGVNDTLCTELDCVLMALPSWGIPAQTKCRCRPRTISATFTHSDAEGASTSVGLSSRSTTTVLTNTQAVSYDLRRSSPSRSVAILRGSSSKTLPAQRRGRVSLTLPPRNGGATDWLSNRTPITGTNPSATNVRGRQRHNRTLTRTRGGEGLVSVDGGGSLLANAPAAGIVALSLAAIASTQGGDLMWVAGMTVFECRHRSEPTGLLIMGIIPLRAVVSASSTNDGGNASLWLLRGLVASCLLANAVALVGGTLLLAAVHSVIGRAALGRRLNAATVGSRAPQQGVHVDDAWPPDDSNRPLLPAPPENSFVPTVAMISTSEASRVPVAPHGMASIGIAAAGLPSTVLAFLGPTADPLLAAAFALLVGFPIDPSSALALQIVAAVCVVGGFAAFVAFIGRAVVTRSMIFVPSRGMSRMPEWLRVSGRWEDPESPAAFVAFTAMYGPPFARLRAGSLPGRWDRGHVLAELTLAAIGSCLRGALQPRGLCVALSICNMCIAVAYVGLAATRPRTIVALNHSRLLQRVVVLAIVALTAGVDLFGWTSTDSLRRAMMSFVATWRVAESVSTALVHRRFKREARRVTTAVGSTAPPISINVVTPIPTTADLAIGRGKDVELANLSFCTAASTSTTSVIRGMSAMNDDNKSAPSGTTSLNRCNHTAVTGAGGGTNPLLHVLPQPAASWATISSASFSSSPSGSVRNQPPR